MKNERGAMYTDRPALQLHSSHRTYVFLPIGSCEQHGPHLPVDTDLRIAQLIVDELAHLFPEEETRVLPVLPFSCSWEHKGVGMIAINSSTLAALLHDIARSLLTWKTPFVFILVSWHGGNAALGSIATEISAQHNLPTFVLAPLALAQRLWQEQYGPLPQDIHAGALETAVVKAFWPTFVSDTTAENGVSSASTGSAQLFLQAVGIAGVSSNGVWGYPERGEPEQGRRLITHVVQELEKQIHTVVDVLEKEN